MKVLDSITLKDIQNVYGGPEGDLWELIMGEQIHIGGFQSSMDLAKKAGIEPGMKGIDICCCNGAGMRFLVRFFAIDSITGIDATEKVIEQGKQRCRDLGLSDKIKFVLSEVCKTGLPSNDADFIWGEDAWCYVVDKSKLISEAVRMVKRGGRIAFTDWMEGSSLSLEEAKRYMSFMKFPTILSLEEYQELLKKNGCEIIAAQDTGRFAPYTDLYINMLEMQLTYDGLKIIGFDLDLMRSLAGEMKFMQDLAHQKKIVQGLIVAQKK